MPDQDLFLERALLEASLVDRPRLEQARSCAAERKISLAEALVQLEILTGHQVALVRADMCEVPFVELTDFEPCFANVALVPRAIADRHCLFPLFMIDGVLTVAMDDPLNLAATDQIRRLCQCDVDVVLAERQRIEALIAKAYALGHGQTAADKAADEPPASEIDEASEPVVAAVNQMLADAVEHRASDIHINPDEGQLHLRYRIDGVLHEKQGPPMSMHAGIVQRIKVMSRLDLTQTRRPQDGKLRFIHQDRPIDVRVSTVPTVYGENVVLRLLGGTQVLKNFHELGMPAPLAAEVEEAINQPYGMLLVTGPTGSGKTTTLYTALAQLNTPSRNLMTIEDPVEIRMPYARQIQVNEEIGLTFANALRSILRQDPDVVLVGEIRDHETATIALQSALTGHLVLSTLHTNDAVGAISRLRDYGLPAFIINSTLLGVVAQRLVRRVCSHCAEPHVPDETLRHAFGVADDAQGFMRGKGCSRCGQTGYRGRVGLYEFFHLTPEIKALVEKDVPAEELLRLAAQQGMRLMWQDGLEKALLGQTTLDEIIQVVPIHRSLGDGAATPTAVKPAKNRQPRPVAQSRSRA